MEQKFPFSTYDFWGYLSAGFLLLFVVDQVAGTFLLMRETWTIVQGIIAVSCAYVAGHLVASMSSWLFERIVVGMFLGYPSNVLFKQPKAWKFVQKMLPGYFQPLPEETQLAALNRAKQKGVLLPGQALFGAAYVQIKGVSSVAVRLANFLNMYGFCRNIAFVALLDAALLYWSYLRPHGAPNHLLWSRIALFVSVGMFIRYLKFFRHYAVEVFSSYAYPIDPDKKA